MFALVMVGFVTGCVDQSPEATPSASNGVDSRMPPTAQGSMATVARAVSPPAKPNYVIVEPGRSLNGIAYSHHVSPAALAAANNLTPPYKLKIGSRLLLPSAGTPAIHQAAASSAPPVPSLPQGASPRSPPQNQKTVAAAPPDRQIEAPSAMPDVPSIKITAPPSRQSQKQVLDVPELPKTSPVIAETQRDVVTESGDLAVELREKTPFTKTIENGVAIYRGSHP